MMSARRVETLQGYGGNDKWTLSELLLDIVKTTDETQISVLGRDYG